MNLTCIIVDDEPLAIRLLENFVERTPFLVLKASFTDSISALQTIKNDVVDLLFLDIQMPDLNGMELSRMVPSRTRIIFTTAFKEYAFDSYEVNALDFLLKPIRYDKFLTAAEKARDWFERLPQPINNQRTTVFLKADGEFQQVPLTDVVYVEGMKDYVIFHLSDRRLVTHMTMKAVEELLPSAHFMRVSRSYIVALDKIRKVDRNDCIYIGNEIIHVTDAFLAPFKEYLEERKR
ncbi:LytTR family DNA-binding domain-containing protein [Prevotella nigrescens]|uniref:LytR/AlgR family response regulator transcription factor n=1 Tax=Prevotella nigrescens TaxID=28133 RepID=UPI0028EB8DF7|nr:LytTR family DNA-binding domain-containing protein [Prevotella nigrescens]